MPDTTTRLELPYPVLADEADANEAIQPLADKLDGASAWVPFMRQGTSLPAVGTVEEGSVYVHETTKTVYVSTGSDWIELQGNGGASVIGAIQDFAGSSDPVDPSGTTRWLLCDGRLLDSITNTQYAALYTAIGTTYGGTSASSFRIPDFVGRTSVMADASGTRIPNSARTLGTSGGAEVHSHTFSMPSHTHTGSSPDHLHYCPVPDHLHGVGSLYTGDHAHYIALWTGTASRGSANYGGGGGESVAFTNHAHYWEGASYGSGAVGIGGQTGASDRGLAVYSHGADRSLAFTTSGPSTLGPTVTANVSNLQPYLVVNKIIRVA